MTRKPFILPLVIIVLYLADFSFGMSGRMTGRGSKSRYVKCSSDVVSCVYQVIKKIVEIEDFGCFTCCVKFWSLVPYSLDFLLYFDYHLTYLSFLFKDL